MKDEIYKLEVFIGLWKYLVYRGKKVPEDYFPFKGGIRESDIEILEMVLEDEENEIKKEKITADETRYTVFLTHKEYRAFIMAMDQERIPIEM